MTVQTATTLTTEQAIKVGMTVSAHRERQLRELDVLIEAARIARRRVEAGMPLFASWHGYELCDAAYQVFEADELSDMRDDIGTPGGDPRDHRPVTVVDYTR